jgi:hypothetical protein
MEHSNQEAQTCASPALQCAGMQQHTGEEATVAELSSPECPKIETYMGSSISIHRTKTPYTSFLNLFCLLGIWRS